MAFPHVAQVELLLRRPCCNGADFAPISRAGFLDRKMWRINAQVQTAGGANSLKLGCCDPQVGLYAKSGLPLEVHRLSCALMLRLLSLYQLSFFVAMAFDRRMFVSVRCTKNVSAQTLLYLPVARSFLAACRDG